MKDGYENIVKIYLLWIMGERDLNLMVHGTYFIVSSFDYLLNHLNMLTKQSACDMTLKYYILQVEQEIALLNELKHKNIV